MFGDCQPKTVTLHPTIKNAGNSSSAVIAVSFKCWSNNLQKF